MVAQRGRRADAQQALGCAAAALHGRLGPAQLLEDLAAVLVEAAPYLGQAVATRGALQQARAQVGFQLLHMLAHRSEEHTSELQSPCNLVCRLLLEKKKISPRIRRTSISI